jgi:hypothetical protein
MRQASMTMSEYFRHAVETIDGRFGEGYAKKNPALVTAFIQGAVGDYATGFLAQRLDDLVAAIGNLAEAHGKLAEAQQQAADAADDHVGYLENHEGYKPRPKTKVVDF